MPVPYQPVSHFFASTVVSLNSSEKVSAGAPVVSHEGRRGSGVGLGVTVGVGVGAGVAGAVTLGVADGVTREGVGVGCVPGSAPPGSRPSHTPMAASSTASAAYTALRYFGLLIGSGAGADMGGSVLGVGIVRRG